MTKESAQTNQKGIATPILIIGVVVVALIVIGVASGGLKGSFKVTTNNQSSDQPASESSESVNNTIPTEIPVPTTAPLSSATKLYSSTDFNFSFEYPESWLVNEASDNITIALMEEGKANNAAAAITATSKPLGTAKGLQFASVLDMQKVALKKEFNVSDFSVDKATKVGNREARLLEFNGSFSGNSLTGRYLTVIDENNMYAITVLADTDKWSKYSGDLQKTLDSFKLLK